MIKREGGGYVVEIVFDIRDMYVYYAMLYEAHVDVGADEIWLDEEAMISGLSQTRDE